MDWLRAMADTRAYLFDAGSGTMLGMISTGAWRNAVEFAPAFAAIVEYFAGESMPCVSG